MLYIFAVFKSCSLANIVIDWYFQKVFYIYVMFKFHSLADIVIDWYFQTVFYIYVLIELDIAQTMIQLPLKSRSCREVVSR